MFNKIQKNETMQVLCECLQTIYKLDAIIKENWKEIFRIVMGDNFMVRQYENSRKYEQIFNKI